MGSHLERVSYGVLADVTIAVKPTISAFHWASVMPLIFRLSVIVGCSHAQSLERLTTLSC